MTSVPLIRLAWQGHRHHRLMQQDLWKGALRDLLVELLMFKREAKELPMLHLGLRR